MNLTLLMQMDAHATLRPDAVAIVEADATGKGLAVTWRQMRDAVISLSRRLRSLVKPGDVILLCGANDRSTLIAYYACFTADLTVLPLASSTTSRELREVARSSGAIAILAPSSTLDSHPALELIRIDLADGWWHPIRTHPAQTSRALDQCTGRSSLLLQSSGTTGIAKLVRRDLAALTCVGRNCVTAIDMTADDHMLAVVPITHSYGIDHAVIAWMLCGCTIVLCNRFDPSLIHHLIETQPVTLIPATPFMLDALSRESETPARQHRLRHVYSAGSTLPLRVAHAFEREFGIFPGQVYGSTEFGSVTFNNPLLEPFDPLSAGRAMEGVTIQITSQISQADSVEPAGVEGNVSVSAPSMMNGYVGQTQAIDIEGFLATGDLGRIDEHARLTITGRTKLLIEVGGLKVNPIEVESVLLSHPSVREAAVIPMKMSDTIQRAKAIIVCDNGERDVESVRAYLRESLSPYKVPREFEVRQSLPRSATGKLLRGELR